MLPCWIYRKEGRNCINNEEFLKSPLHLPIVDFQRGLETGQAEPNTWMFLQQLKNRKLKGPTSELCDQVKAMDIVFNDYHGPGCNLRYGKNILAATQTYILSQESTKDILPSVVNLFVKIKIHQRLKVIKNKKSKTRNFTKTGHFNC